MESDLRRWMDLVEARKSKAPAVDFLYHVTDGSVLHLIFDEGIDPGYWGTLSVIQYYISMRLVSEPIVFRVPFSAFRQEHLEPDLPGIQDPPSAEVTGMTEDEISDAWDASGQSWQDSLKLIGSVKYWMHVAVTMENLFIWRGASDSPRVGKPPK